MKAVNKFLLPVLMLILLPVMASAHPGHDHSGGFLETFIHFLFTYYIYVIISLVLIAGIFRYVQVMRSRQKHDMVSKHNNKE